MPANVELMPMSDEVSLNEQEMEESPFPPKIDVVALKTSIASLQWRLRRRALATQHSLKGKHPTTNPQNASVEILTVSK